MKLGVERAGVDCVAAEEDPRLVIEKADAVFRVTRSVQHLQFASAEVDVVSPSASVCVGACGVIAMRPGRSGGNARGSLSESIR